ncbi:D-alanyl-D-alanine carboxypeptidase family protein [Moraxella atlantae]|uniref:M15 family metallopeptidase n=1 Tax=Faucicola atlantae TaxID=34059 RepID=UPI003752CB7E
MAIDKLNQARQNVLDRLKNNDALDKVTSQGEAVLNNMGIALPQGMPQITEEQRRQALQSIPATSVPELYQAEIRPYQTFGDIGKDVGLSLGQSVLELGKLPVTAADFLATQLVDNKAALFNNIAEFGVKEGVARYFANTDGKGIHALNPVLLNQIDFNTANEILESWKSDRTHYDNRVLQQDIDSKDGLVGKFSEAFKGTISNPNLLSQGITQNLLPMVAGGYIAKGATALPALWRSGFGEGAVETLSSLANISTQNPKGYAGGRELGYALGSGVATAAVNRVIGGGTEGDITSRIAGTANTSKGLVNKFKNVPVEPTQEFLQTIPQEILQQKAINNEVDFGEVSSNTGKATAIGAAMGSHSAVSFGKTATTLAGKTLYDKAAEVYQNKVNPYDYDIASNPDNIQNNTYNPTEVVKRNLRVIVSPDASMDARTTALSQITETGIKLKQRMFELKEVVDNAKTVEEEDKALAELKEFNEQYYKPYLAQKAVADPFIENIAYPNNSSNQSIDDFIKNVNANSKIRHEDIINPSDNINSSNPNETTSPIQSSQRINETQTLQLGTIKVTAQLKNDGDGKGNYFEVNTKNGKTRYYQYNETHASDLKDSINTPTLNFAGNVDKIHKDAYQPLVNLSAEFNKKFGIPLTVISGFRSYDYQKENLKNKFAKGRLPKDVFATNSWVGGSKHHTGLAFDLISTDTDFWKTDKGKKISNWLKANTGKFGFELSYPEDNLNGVSHEAWEFVYKGTEKAKQALTPVGAGISQPTKTSTVNPVNLVNKTIPVKQIDTKSFKHNIVPNAFNNNGNMQSHTMEFAQILDQNGLDGLINAFTSFNGGTHAKGAHSHENGFKFDIDLKNDDDIDTYRKAVKLVQQLANEHGYEVVVYAEKDGWGNVGEGFRHVKGAGSHLDIKVLGRKGASNSSGYYHVANNNDIASSTIKQLPNGRWVSDNPILDKFIAVESSGNANAKNGSFKGLFQLGDKFYNLKNPFDARENFEVAKQTLLTNKKALEQAGIPVNETTLYLAHQQGLKGFKEIWNAAQNGTQVSKKIRGHMDSNKGTGRTAKEFIDYWSERINTVYATVRKDNNITDKPNNQSGGTDFGAVGTQLQAANIELNEAKENNDSEKIKELETKIADLETKLNESQQPENTAQEKSNTLNNHTELKPSYTEQFTQEEQQANVNEAKKYIKANTLTANHIDTLEQTGAINQNQAIELRLMLDNQRALTAMNNVEQVHSEAIQGRRKPKPIDSMIGLNDYVDILDHAIETNDIQSLSKHMAYLERFARNSNNKHAAIQEALARNPNDNNPLYIARDTNHVWDVYEGRVKDNPDLFKAGAFQVWQNTRANDYIAKEAQYTQEILNNYKSIIATRQQSGQLSDYTQTSLKPKQSKFNNNPTQETSTPININSNTTGLNRGQRVTVPNTNVVYQTRNDNINYQPKSNEVLVGHNYQQTNNGTIVPINYGLSGFTNNNSKGNIFDLAYINEAGALANPYTSSEKAGKHSFNVRDNNLDEVGNRQNEIDAYINLMKNLTTTQKANRQGLLDVLPQLNGKTLVTDNYHIHEALFLDYLAKGLNNPELDTREKKQEWIERIKPIYGKDSNGNLTIQFKQDNKTSSLDVLKNNRLDHQNRLTTLNTDKKNKSINKPTNSKPKQAINENTNQATVTNNTVEISNQSNVENKQEQVVTQSNKESNSTTNAFDLSNTKVKAKEKAPSEMLSRRESKAKSKQQKDETLEEAINRLENVDLSKPQPIIEVLEQLLYEKSLAGLNIRDEKTTNYLKNLATSTAMYLDNPKVVIDNSIDTPTYDAKTNTVKVRLSQNVLEDIAGVLITQSTIDIANEVNDYTLEDYLNLKQDANESDIINKDELEYARRIASISHKLKTVRDNLSIAYPKMKVDKQTNIAIQQILHGNLGAVLSTGLLNPNIRELLKSISYRRNKKAPRSSLYNFLVNALHNFLGISYERENILDTLLSIQGDIAEIKLLKSDFNNTGDAKLSVLQQDINKEKSKPKQQQNRFLISFSQSGQTTLSKVKDIAIKLYQDPVKAVHFILGEQITPEQKAQLEDFLDFKNKFTLYIKSSFADSTKSKDLKSYLYNPDTGQIDDNLLTALSLSAYSWILINGNKEINTVDEIKKLLNVDKDSDIAIPSHIIKDYKYKGNLLPFVASDIGKLAVQTLGIKETDDAIRFSKAELEMSIGNWVVSAMQIAGLIQIVEMDKQQHLDNIQAVSGAVPEFELNDNAADYRFVTVKSAENVQKHERINEILSYNKGTHNFLSRLFNTDIGLRSPVFKPPQSIKRKIKRTDSIVSNQQATFINKMQSASIEIDTTTYDTMDKLLTSHNSWFKQLIGAEVTQEQLNKMHINDRDSAEASAEGLRRELDNAMAFVSGLKRTANGLQKFYDSIYVAINNRMHYNSNMFNMQTSLIHRMMASYSNFKTTIDLTGITLENLTEHALEKDKPTKIGLFLSALAMNLEGTENFIKANVDMDLQAYTKDKVPSDIFLPAFIKWINTQDVQKAVKAMQNVIGNTYTNTDLNAIQGFVEQGDMGIQSFRALIELTNFISVIENKKNKSFTTAIGLGSDGINNGIALGSIYNGVADKRTQLQTGFIPNTTNYNNYYDTRLDRNIGDYYEAYAEKLSATMNALLNNKEFLKDTNLTIIEAIQKIQPAFDFVKNPKAARKFAKSIVIPFGYSAGINRLVQVAEETFLGDIQKQFTKLSTKSNTSQEYIELQDNLRQLLDDFKFNLPENPKDLLEFWFTPKQVNIISNNYKMIVGTAIKQSLNEFAGEFKDARQRNIALHEATYSMYASIYDAIVNHAMNELGLNEVKERGFTNQEWNDLVKPKLDSVTPRIINAFITTHGDNVLLESDEVIDPYNTGIAVYSIGRKLKGNKVKSKTKLAFSNDELRATQYTLPSMETFLDSVGVLVNSVQIQGTDSRISAAASAMLGLDGVVNLNIHDQNDGGLDNYIKMVLTQNKTTFETLATNHIQLNSLETFIDTLINLNQLMKDGLIKKSDYESIVDNIPKLLGMKDETVSIEDAVNWYINSVENTELDKLDILKNLKAVQQYAGETGEYIIGDKDITLAETQMGVVRERLNQLRDRFKDLGYSTSTNIDNSNTNTTVTLPKKNGVPQEIHDKDQANSNQVKNNKNNTVQFTVDNVTHNIPADLIDTTVIANEVSSKLLEFTSNNQSPEFKNFSINQLKRLININPNVKISFVQSDKELLELANKNRNTDFVKSAGGSTRVNKDGSIHIFINVNDIPSTRDKTEILYHEYIHAMTKQVLNHYLEQWQEREKSNQEYNGTLRALIEARDLLVEYAQQTEFSSSDFDYMTHPNNWNEILTLGLTNEDIVNILLKIKPSQAYIAKHKDKNINMENLYTVLYSINERAINYAVNNDLYSTKGLNNDNPNTTTEPNNSRMDGTKSRGLSPTTKHETTQKFENTRTTRGTRQQSDGNSSTQSISNQRIDNPNTWIEDKINKLLSNNDSKDNFAQLELMQYIFRRIDDTKQKITIKIVNEDTIKSINNGNDALGLYNPNDNTIYLKDSYVNTGNDFSVVATVLHELLHQLTEAGLTSQDESVVVAREELQRIFDHLKKKVKPTNNPSLDAKLAEVFNQNTIAELITYGITDPEFTQWMVNNLKDFNVKSKGLSNYISQLKHFINAVIGLFNWDKDDSKNFTNFVRLVDKLTKAIPKPTNEVKEVKANTLPANNTISTEHDEHLNKIDSIIQSFKNSNPNRRVLVDNYSSNKTNDNLSYIFGLTDKEKTIYESVKAVVETYIKTQGNNLAVRELAAIYQELHKGKITKEDFVRDWNTASKQEKAYAQSVYNQLFGTKQSTDHLVKFIALALSSEQFRDVLSIARERITNQTNESWFDKIMSFFEKVINTLKDLTLNSRNESIKNQIDILFNKLDNIDKKDRNNALNLYEQTWEGLVKSGQFIDSFTKTALSKAINKITKNNPSTVLSKIGNTVNTTLNKDIAATFTLLLETTALADKALNNSGRYGETRELINEFASNTAIKKVQEKLLRLAKNIGQIRLKIKDSTRQALLDTFSRDLDLKERESITHVVLRTDLASMLDYMSMGTVMSFFKESTRRAKIAQLEQRIEQMNNGIDMLLQSKELAAYMLKNKSSDTLTKSAQGIAIGQGMPYQTDFEHMNQQLYEDINTLVSLYTLDYAMNEYSNIFNPVLDTESNGIKEFLRLHHSIHQMSKKEFEHNPYNYIKGYLPDISNPRRNIRSILIDDLQDYLKDGWVVLSNDLNKDISDKTDKRVLIYHDRFNYQDRVSGSLDLKDTHIKGNEIYTIEEGDDLTRVAKEKLGRRLERNATVDYKTYNPFETGSYLIPNYAADGSLLSYRYEMEGFLRDNYLERNNDAFTLISTLNAKLQVQPELEKTQRNTAKACYEDYQKNYAMNPHAFVIMTPESNDPKVAADFALMPYEFRKEAQRLFGKNQPIVVRASVYNMMFGYKAYSISEMFDKVSNDKNVLEKLVTAIFTKVFGDKAKARAITLENIFRTLTKYGKDFIVIRAYKTLMGNIIANALLLTARGIDPITMGKDFVVAWQEGQRYNKAQNKLLYLKTKLQTATQKDKPKIKQEIMQLQDYMDRSIMKPYMDAGMMSTIIEDVATLKDEVEYMTTDEQFIKELRSKIPSKVLTTFDWLVINSNTPLHKFMSDANQFSDFAAKYALAKHLQKQGMSFENALSEAQESFINFDIPHGRGMDYMNRIGLFMFTKFFIRFQKVLSKLMRDKPATMLAQHFGIEYIFDVAGILEPAFINNIGNPFDAGMVSPFRAADEIMTIDVITGLW